MTIPICFCYFPIFFFSQVKSIISVMMLVFLDVDIHFIDILILYWGRGRDGGNGDWSAEKDKGMRKREMRPY